MLVVVVVSCEQFRKVGKWCDLQHLILAGDIKPQTLSLQIIQLTLTLRIAHYLLLPMHKVFTMKIDTITATLLFVLKASSAYGFEINGDCDHFEIYTDKDCDTQCKSYKMNYSGNMQGPRDNITECSCTLLASKKDISNGAPAESKFTCTRAKPEPEPADPVIINENCDKRNITTYDDCKATCSALAAPSGYSARINGEEDNISACFCTYGENSFTCHREPTYPAIPQKRSGLCSDYGIDDQVTCGDFCMKYQRYAQYISNANGLLWCRCQRGQGGEVDWKCKGDQDSYLRSD